MRTLWDPIMFTNNFYFKIQIKNLLVDVSFKLMYKTPINTLVNQYLNFMSAYICCRPPLWSSGQSFWLQIQRSRVRFPALPDFLSGSGSGTGCTHPREPREVN